MVINRGFFINEIYLPEASPAVTDQYDGNYNLLQQAINKYPEVCLFEVLGPRLAQDFIDQFNPAESNYIDSLAHSKWVELMTGFEYTDPVSDLIVNWRGIQFKTPSTATDFNTSLLAYYTYYYYEKVKSVNKTTVGDSVTEADGAEMVGPTYKLVEAWNQFVKLVMGGSLQPSVTIGSKGLGIDYYQNNQNVHVGLYKYIEDMNTINGDDYYPNFKKANFELMNYYGI